MAGMGDPLATMNSAAGDLGLSQAAKDQAQDIANKAKKKKLEEQMNLKAGVPAVAQSAFQSLTGIGTP